MLLTTDPASSIGRLPSGAAVFERMQLERVPAVRIITVDRMQEDDLQAKPRPLWSPRSPCRRPMLRETRGLSVPPAAATLKVRAGSRSRPSAHWCCFSEPVLEPGPRSRAPAIDDAARCCVGASGDLVQETTRFHDRAVPAVVLWASSSHASPPCRSEIAPMAKPARSSRTRAPRVPRKTNPTPPVMNPDAGGIDIGATHLYAALPQDRST